jgi:hypothetical protein
MFIVVRNGFAEEIRFKTVQKHKPLFCGFGAALAAVFG